MKTRILNHLPNPNPIGDFSKWSLVVGEELEGITAYLKYVIEKRQHATDGKNAGEHADEAELNEHFQVIISRIIIL